MMYHFDIYIIMLSLYWAFELFSVQLSGLSEIVDEHRIVRNMGSPIYRGNIGSPKIVRKWHNHL